MYPLITLLLLTNCENQGKVIPDKTINTLVNDPSFKRLVQDSMNSLDRGSADIKTINAVLSKESGVTESDLPQLSNALGYSNHLQLEKEISSLKETLIELNIRHNLKDLSKEEFRHAIKIVISEYRLEQSKMAKLSSYSCLSDCYNAAILCRDSVTLDAMMAHFACMMTSDWSVFGGVLCHSIVTAWAAAKLADCTNSLDFCIQGCQS